MTAYLLLAAMAWAGATRGGTDARDLVIVFVLVAASVATAQARPSAGLGPWAASGVLLAYLIVNGPLRRGWSLDSVRMPLLILIVAMALLAVAGMNASDREVLTAGLIILGTLQAVIALVAVIVSAVSGGVDLSVPPRGEGLLGFPNGLGVLLVGTSILTLRQLIRGRRRAVAGMALIVQVTAILATGSRIAILIMGILIVVTVVVRSATVRGRREAGLAAWPRPAGYVLAVCATVAGVAMVAWRTVVEPNEDRPQLWVEAMQRIAAAPLFGEGAPAKAFELVSESSRVTTSAHNEILQWTLEYGLVGVGLAGAVILLALRGTRPWSRGDRWALVAAAALLASGLTGFSPRITVVALAAVVLVGLGASPAPEGLRDRPPLPPARLRRRAVDRSRRARPDPR